jgi:hypothetical protein
VMMLRTYKGILSSGLTGTLLVACSGVAPSSSAPLPLTTSLTGASVKVQGSWIRPGASKSDLLYVTSLGNHVVYIFTYPRLELVGLIGQYRRDQPVAICSDAKGNVFVPVIYQHKILEFSHGGTRPIASLNLPNSYPYSCAFDPATGDLAVAAGLPGAHIGVAIYAHEKGKPKTYDDPYLSDTPYCGYDNRGNLFCDGQGISQNFGFSELAKGAKSFSDITVNEAITTAGTVQWDGSSITVFQGGSGSGIIYRLKVSGSTATVVGTTMLKDAAGGGGSWIIGHQVIVAEQPRAAVQLYRYPRGGNFFKSKAIYQATYATVSVAPIH